MSTILEACKTIEDAIWNNKPLSNGKKLLAFSGGRCKGLDSNDGKYRFIQQNPFKNTEYARRAQYGAHIIWVFKEGKYFARYEDGKIYST